MKLGTRKEKKENQNRFKKHSMFERADGVPIDTVKINRKKKKRRVFGTGKGNVGVLDGGQDIRQVLRLWPVGTKNGSEE